MPVPVLHIGNKNYSSWSMRAWLALKWGGIPFEEKLVALGGEGYGRGEIKEVRAISPSGRVPALHVGDTVIYESTVYPGCTEEVCVPILEKASGLRFNEDFFAGYSPERINPGDKAHRVTNILKVTSGSTPEVADRVDAL